MPLLDEPTIGALQRRAREGTRTPDRRRVRPPQPPASQATLHDAEASLGFPLPEVVRQVYTEIGNGGFGPGYGLIGIGGGALTDLGDDAVTEYHNRRKPDHDDATWSWPERLLPICHWGCAIYSSIDCTSDMASVVRFDPNPVDDDWSLGFASEEHTLDSWLRAWLDGADLFSVAVPAMRDE